MNLMQFLHNDKNNSSVQVHEFQDTDLKMKHIRSIPGKFQIGPEQVMDEDGFPIHISMN